MKRIVFEVTQEDIDKGEPLNGSRCPVYLGLSRAINNLNIHVTTEVVYQRSPTHSVGAKITKRIALFISHFDSGAQSIKPSHFAILMDERLIKNV